MKINPNFLKCLLLSMPLFIGSCSEDDTNSPQESNAVQVAFESEVSEPGGDVTSFDVVLTFSENAAKSGSIRVGLAGKMAYGTHFYTEPVATNGELEVPLIKGQGTAKFTVHKLADVENGENLLQFILKTPSNSFVLGDPSLSLLRFKKGTPDFSSVEFSSATAELWEDDTDGIILTLALSAALETTELVTIDLNTSEHLVYGQDFITDPLLVLGQLILEIPAGALTSSVKIIPIDNNVLGTDYSIALQISATTGYLIKGDISEMHIDFRDDDDLEEINIHTIAEVRERFNQYPGDWYFPEDYFIEGVITSTTNVTDEKTVYIQDETAGILLHFGMNNLLHYGDKVRLNLKNATGISLNGQKSIDGIADRLGTLLDEEVWVNPEEISLEQLLSGNYEGRRVRVSGVSFSAANGVATFEGNRIISNGTFSAVVKTFASAAFSTAVLPEGMVTIQGVVGDYGYLLPQLMPSDIQL